MFEIDPVIFELSNGIRVVFTRRDAFVAHMGVLVRAGSRFESKEEEGLAHFVEHTIFQGTSKRKAVDIFSELDSVGGELNAYTNKEELCLHASFRKSHLSIASSLLNDLIENPTFPHKEIEKEKSIVVDEINSYLDNPSERIFDEFEEHLFNDHPLGYNTLGSKESVNRLGHNSLIGFAKRMFHSKNLVIAVVGDFNIDELRILLEKDFSSIPSGEEPTIDSFDEENYSVFNVNDNKSNYQSHILLGGLAPVKTTRERRVMTLIANYLGGPALNSKLALSVREKHGYAYNIEANYTPYSDVGFWCVYAGTDTKYIDNTIALIKDEVEDLYSNGISEDELESAKEQLKGHIALSLDSNLELMFYLGKSVLFDNKVNTIAEIYEQVDLINSEDVLEIAKMAFSPDHLSKLVYEFT
jgi:predicted Zn-dependent peptidase